MPLYEYYCDHCQKKFEEMKSIKDKNTAICPDCNKTAQKQVNTFAINSSGGGHTHGKGCFDGG